MGNRPKKKSMGEVARCQAIEIVDRATGNVVSDTTQDKIVGQKVQLEVRTRPVGRTMTNINWTIPGETVKNYTQSAATGTRTDLAAGDLQVASIDFYWISSGNKQVQVSADVEGTTLTATVTYNVLAPTGATMTSVTGNVAVDNPGFPGAGLELHYGTNVTPGITWTLTCTAPVGGAGKIAGTQLVNADRSETTNADVTQNTSTGGDWWLDTTVPYSAAVAIAAGANATWTSSDSPGSPLTAGYKESTADDGFRLYFMYKPSGADSIWVTLMRLDWDWAGETTRVGAPAGAGNNWNAPTDVDNTQDPSGVASIEFPTWTDNIIDV